MCVRVRQWAVVGAAFAVAWTGGAGIASATDDSTTTPGCLPPLAVSDTEVQTETSPEPCLPKSEGYAQIGCSGPGVLEVWVSDLQEGDEVVAEVGGTTSEPDTADEDGDAVLYVEVPAGTTGSVSYEVSYTDGGDVVDSGTVEVDETCQGDADLVVSGDCVVPETLELQLAVTGLLPDEDYTVVYASEGFVPADGEPKLLTDEFTTDGSGAATLTTTVTEDAEVTFPDGQFTIGYEVYLDGDDTTSIEGQAVAEACPVDEGTTPGTTPPTIHPAPVVVQPVVQHPAVLANTGTPTAMMVLLGGGLLVAGTGALVATRRRV